MFKISSKEYSRFDINKYIAESGFIPVAINKHQDPAFKQKSSSVLVNDIINTYEYNPCQNPSDTWPIIEKCWDELTNVACLSTGNLEWHQLVLKHNCTKLEAVCICFIECNGGE
jgi:hypothetical protein